MRMAERVGCAATKGERSAPHSATATKCTCSSSKGWSPYCCEVPHDAPDGWLTNGCEWDSRCSD